MPIKKRWSKLTPDNLGNVPDKPGVYELGNKKKQIIDIGGSDDSVKSRLQGKQPPSAKFFRYKAAKPSQSGIKMEAEEGAKFKEQQGGKPKHTRRLPKP